MAAERYIVLMVFSHIYCRQMTPSAKKNFVNKIMLMWQTLMKITAWILMMMMSPYRDLKVTSLGMIMDWIILSILVTIRVYLTQETQTLTSLTPTWTLTMNMAGSQKYLHLLHHLSLKTMKGMQKRRWGAALAINNLPLWKTWLHILSTSMISMVARLEFLFQIIKILSLSMMSTRPTSILPILTLLSSPNWTGRWLSGQKLEVLVLWHFLNY